MLKIIEQYKIIGLIIISIIIGIIWRVELEYHGWHGLIWTSYYHFAVPIGLILFIIWGNLIIRIKPSKRLILNIIGIIFGFGIFYLIELSLTYTFIGGPSAMFMMMSMPDWKLNLIIYSIFVLIPLLSIVPFVILKLFKQKISILKLVLSLLIIIASVPVSIFILELSNHKGSYDIIHIIKSGIIIPFIVFAIGLVFITKKSHSSRPIVLGGK